MSYPEEISIVIPAYNEEAVIENTLKAVQNYLQTKNISAEVLVVNDGSSDKTPELVQNFPGVKLINQPRNFGKGKAVRTGYLQARNSVVVVMDADNSLPIDNLDKVFPVLERYDIVIASRYLSGELKKATFFRRLASNFFSMTVRLLLGIQVSDTQCGFKVFKKPQCDSLFVSAEIDGWAYDVEILALAVRKGLKIGEFPVTFVPEERPSKIGNVVKTSLKMLREILKVKKNLMFSGYSKNT